MTVNPIMLNVNACKKFAWFPKLGSSFRANKEAIEPATIPLGAFQLRKQRSRIPRSVLKLEAITERTNQNDDTQNQPNPVIKNEVRKISET